VTEKKTNMRKTLLMIGMAFAAITSAHATLAFKGAERFAHDPDIPFGKFEYFPKDFLPKGYEAGSYWVSDGYAAKPVFFEEKDTGYEVYIGIFPYILLGDKDKEHTFIAWGDNTGSQRFYNLYHEDETGLTKYGVLERVCKSCLMDNVPTGR
jgi:hypothetical protein